jgi:hypothetical protein
MARREISDHFAIDFGNDNPAWREMRNSPGTDTYLEKLGEEVVARCNADLRAAQAKRKQPVEDGYDFHITHGSRSRLNIFPTTARAIAHEAVNQTILKTMPMGAKGHTGAPDHEIPRELARRSNEAQEHAGVDEHGEPIHNLDRGRR